MRRIICRLFLGAAVSLFVSVAASAAGINSAEQRLLDTVSQPFSYNGKTYAVTDGSIASARARLSQEGTDLTDGLVNDCISQFGNSHAELVEGGYCRELEPPADKEDTQTTTPAPTSEPEHSKSERRQNKAFLKRILGEPSDDGEVPEDGKTSAKENKGKEQTTEEKSEPASTAVPSPTPEKAEDVWDVEGGTSAAMDFDSRDVKSAVKGQMTVDKGSKKYTLGTKRGKSSLERYMKRFLSLGKILYAVLLAVTGLAVLLLVNCIFSNKGRHGRKRRGGVPAVLAGICIAGWSLFLLLGFSLYFGVFHQGVAARQLMESDYFSGVAQMAREQAAKRLQDNGYDTGISEEAFALSNIYIDEKQYTDDVLSGKKNAKLSVDKVHKVLSGRLDKKKDALLIRLIEEDYKNISKFEIGTGIRACRDSCRGMFYLAVFSGVAACILLFLLIGRMYRNFYKAAGIGAAGLFPASAVILAAAAAMRYMADGWKIQVKPVYYQVFLKNYISQSIQVVFYFGCIGIVCAVCLIIWRHYLRKVCA